MSRIYLLFIKKTVKVYIKCALLPNPRGFYELFVFFFLDLSDDMRCCDCPLIVIMSRQMCFGRKEAKNKKRNFQVKRILRLFHQPKFFNEKRVRKAYTIFMSHTIIQSNKNFIGFCRRRSFSYRFSCLRIFRLLSNSRVQLLDFKDNQLKTTSNNQSCKLFFDLICKIH